MKRVVAVLSALMCTACSTTSSDWQRESLDDRVSFERPSAMSAEFTPTAAPWKFGFRSGDGYPEIQVAPDAGEQGQAEVVANRLIGTATINGLPGFRLENTTDLDIDGASSAQRVDFTVERNGITYFGTWITVAQFPYPHSAAVSYLDDEQGDVNLEHLIDSLEVKFPKQ